MITAHVGGFPLEETVLQLAPAGLATVTALVLSGRAQVGRLVARLRGR